MQNALDTMPQGGTVTITGQQTAAQVQLHVQETGSGIAPGQLGQIFEPLYTTKPGGTALAYTLSRGLWQRTAGRSSSRVREGRVSPLP